MAFIVFYMALLQSTVILFQMIYDLLCLDCWSQIPLTQNFSLNTVQLVLPQHTTCPMSTLLAASSRCAQD